MSLILARNECVYGKLTNRGVLSTLRLARAASNNSDEYQYIQRSKVPTLHFQRSLPRLPIPKLEKTCERYLNAQKPLLSDEQFDKTNSYVSKFLKDEGVSLHKALLEKDAKNRNTSYISEPWFDMYLRDRKPLPINYNPFLIFVPEAEAKYNGQLVKATNIIVSSLRFMKSLKANVLEPEVFHLNPKKSDTKMFRTFTRLLPPVISWYGAYILKAFPLDMSQYSNLFNTSRIPELGKDRIYHDDSGRHIVIARNGHFYAFDVLDKAGNILPAKQIASCLKYIIEDNREANKHSVGVMTSSERDAWSKFRCHLEQIGNKETLRKIDSAVFVMCLDDVTLGEEYNKLVKQFLHSDGTNRWFDKSFSVIVTKDGYAGVNFEHSWGDGVAVLRFFQDVKKDISEKPRFHPDEVNTISKDAASIEKLEFRIDEKAQSTIDEEKKKYHQWTNQLCVDHLMYNGFGKDECKKLSVSPDAVMQLAFQLALYKQEGRAVPTYESCSTAAFKHGRTETIRSCTVETKALCAAMTSDKPVEQLRQMIIACSKAHVNLTKAAAMGQGFDRHLFALKKIWEQSGTKTPALFADPAYEALNHNILSTSTLSSPAVMAGGFGPVVPEGYGIGYMIQDKRLGAVVTSYGGSRKANDYVKCLELAFSDINRTLAAQR